MLLIRVHIIGVLTRSSWLSRLSIGTRLLTSTYYDILSLIQVVLIIGEMVVLLGVNDGLDELKSGISFLAQGLGDDFHDLANHNREPLENSTNDLTTNIL